MARKAVLSGGKRDEIIKIAMELFFEYGFEATSVRMIMERAGGEIGMFYHYFKSKNILFDTVVEQFFKNYSVKFSELLESVDSIEDFAQKFLLLFSVSTEQFDKLKDNMHWTIQYAMAALTINALVPNVVEILNRLNIKTEVSNDILAGQLIHGISATIHSEGFMKMSVSEKIDCLISFIKKLTEV